MSAAPSELGLRERGKQRRVAQILDAAQALLREEPERPLTVERIAGRAEVSAPTLFNLIGTREMIWAAIADRALGELDLGGLGRVADPQVRAQRIVGAVISMMCADAPVFRALLVNWRLSAQLVDNDPTRELLVCLREAERSGAIRQGVNLRRSAELISAGLIGIAHQWGAGLIGDDALRRRGRDLVDMAFAAARAPDR
jgi:AcrR family transcriptional regulator